MKKHKSRSGLVRGRAVDTIRPIVIGSNADGTRLLVQAGKKACKLFKVKTGSGRYWRQFVHFCQTHGLVFRIAGYKRPDLPGAQERDALGWYEVYGNEWAMRQLTNHVCVAHWEDCLHVGAPYFRSH